MSANPKLSAKYGQQVARLVDDAELTLLRMISDGLRRGTRSSDWAQMKLAELQLFRKRVVATATRLDLEVAAEIHKVVLQAFNAGSAQAVRELDKLGHPPRPVADAIGAAREIADEIIAKTHAAVAKTPQVMVDAYRKAVAAGEPESSLLGNFSEIRSITDMAFPDVLSGELTRIEGAQKALDEAFSRGISGFTDAAGRNWSLDSYIEMSVRTGTMNAAIGGHIATLQESGLDLVIVSTSPVSCPLCDEWEGKILSLSGDVSDAIMPDVTSGEAMQVEIAGSLDDATAAGLLHPNCTHTIDAYLPGATQVADDAGTAPTEDELAAAEKSPGDQEYQDKQTQRSMERDLREARRSEALSWDDADRAKQAEKVSAIRSDLAEFVMDRRSYLSRQYEREQIGKAH